MSEQEDNVIEFPGYTSNEIDPQKVLDGAKEKGLNSVIVIGYSEDGDLYMASSHTDGPEILWQLEKCKRFLLENFE